MLTSSIRICEKLRIVVDETKIVASGPNGAPDGKRWISIRDVLLYGFKNREITSYSFNLNYEINPLLWPHQKEALEKAIITTKIESSIYKSFVSGIFEMDCGTGKTKVGCELIKMSRAPAFVVTPHIRSTKQWINELKNTYKLNAITLLEARDDWKILKSELPDVVVCTYASVARAFKEFNNMSSTCEDFIIWFAMVKQFGLLILDEVHLAAADQFRMACKLNYGAVYGFSGSLIREDEQLSHLNIGNVLYSYITNKNVTYHLINVPLHPIFNNLAIKNRCKDDYLYKTLNPNKISALKEVLTMKEYSDNRMVIFCDSADAVNYINYTLETTNRFICGSINGETNEQKRENVLNIFLEKKCSVLITSSICNVSVDFPKDCVVVQIHSSNGSRCQEMQRCGRSGRGDATNMVVIHIINENTEEEKFIMHRISHMKNHYKERFILKTHNSKYTTNENDMIPILVSMKENSKKRVKTIDTLYKNKKKRNL
mgnify:CR=1 FL=1|tara:strand:+ start:967 stop:2427 length:1461 start_codon:yes stop_codon:yes gene_type:complete